MQGESRPQGVPLEAIPPALVLSLSHACHELPHSQLLELLDTEPPAVELAKR